MRNLAAVLLSLCVLSWNELSAQGGRFRWLNLNRDQQVLPGIKEALNAIPYTHLREVGVIGQSALVVVATRPDGFDAFDADYDRYQAFTYDLQTKDAKEIWSGYQFKMRGEAQFKAAPVLDMVFSFDNCVECEPTTYLGSFRYDPGSPGWTVRKWQYGKEQLEGAEIASADYLDEWSGEYVYAVRDINGDKLEDIAVWLRQTNSRTKKIVDYVMLYSAEGGKSTCTRVRSTLEITKIKRKVCGSDALISGGWDKAMCRPYAK